MRRLISTSETERLARTQVLLQEIEKRCENTVYDEDLAGESGLEMYRAACLGRAAEAAQVANDSVFNLLNCLSSQCEQTQIDPLLDSNVQGDAV